MAITLNPNEIRVLGVLIEKSMTVPQYYPMTLNAVTVACNQKNNRDPVLSLSEGEVGAALHELQSWQLVTQGRPEPGTRSNKFRHEVEKKFGWTAEQRAVLSELMIRGPQTLAELRTNASRMKGFESTEAVRETLGELERTEQPMIEELPRQTGQRETRYKQLLGPTHHNVEAPNTTSASAMNMAESPTTPPPEGLANRVDELQRKLAALENELAAVRDRLNSAGIS